MLQTQLHKVQRSFTLQTQLCKSTNYKGCGIMQLMKWNRVLSSSTVDKPITLHEGQRFLYSNITSDIPWQYLDNPLLHLPAEVSICTKVTLESDWTSINFPRMTHSSPSKYPSVYTKVTLDIHGLSEDDPLIMNLRVKHESYIGDPCTFRGKPTHNTPPCQCIHVHQSFIGHTWTFWRWPTVNTPLH